MKTRAKPPKPSPEEMRKPIEGLSPAERAMPEVPDFITEDEADLILCGRAMKEPGPSISLDELLAETGISLPAKA